MHLKKVSLLQLQGVYQISDSLAEIIALGEINEQKIKIKSLVFVPEPRLEHFEGLAIVQNEKLLINH